MEASELIAKISSFFIRHARKEEHKSLIRFRTERLLRWLAGITFVVSAFGLLVDGKDFFAVQVPKFQSYAGKALLLKSSFIERTAKRILENEFGYVLPCIAEVLLVDLDNDGSKTDLVIGLYEASLKERQKGCRDLQSYPAQYAIVKEVRWDGFWPSYALVKMIARETPGIFSVGSGFPLSFSSIGNFLIASPYGTDFVGYQIFGYFDGTISDFGQYWAAGGIKEADYTEARLLENNSLIMNLKEGIYRFEFNSNGEPSKQLMTPEAIVEENQSTVVLQQTDNINESKCQWSVMTNGELVEIQYKDTPIGGIHCIGEIYISSLNNIVPLMGCDSAEMTRLRQFPWGYLLNESKADNYLLCDLDGETGEYSYSIKVSRFEK
ncbi:hypothetical protein [Nitrosomonas oligotropha]|uniref:hypothetical protein n=1 Tax=Nitrosomonas oligotropha TaxID=42354 RepID=UPI001371F20D|nr:hypothetical protein [Nitrosomonas oligotropha]MXS83293.1 hypothetical protein [Nitrosomonas oligotropha]